MTKTLVIEIKRLTKSVIVIGHGAIVTGSDGVTVVLLRKGALRATAIPWWEGATFP